MRRCFLNGVVTIEHATDAWTVDLTDDFNRLIERCNDVALLAGQCFDQQGHAAVFEMSGNRGDAIDEVARGFFA